jgi:hypothetical protein
MAESNFDRLAAKLAGRPGVRDPRALAAAIGRKKAAAEGDPGAFAKAGREGRPMSAVIRSDKRK